MTVLLGPSTLRHERVDYHPLAKVWRRLNMPHPAARSSATMRRKEGDA
jgi:hypothetical protein